MSEVIPVPPFILLNSGFVTASRLCSKNFQVILVIDRFVLGRTTLLLRLIVVFSTSSDVLVVVFDNGSSTSV